MAIMKQNFVRLRTTPTEKAYQLGTPFCVWSFPLRRAFSGHTILCAPHSPFLQKPFGKWGAKAKSVVFAFAIVDHKNI